MLRRTYFHLLIVVSLAVSGVFMASCEQSKVPTATNISRTVPRIYPDYTHVTIPANIAPLRFKLCRPELYDAAVVAFYCRELGDAPLIVEKADGDGVNGGSFSGSFRVGICITKPSSYGYNLKYFRYPVCHTIYP